MFDLYVSQVVLDEILARDPMPPSGGQRWPQAFLCWTSRPKSPISLPP